VQSLGARWHWPVMASTAAEPLVDGRDAGSTGSDTGANASANRCRRLLQIAVLAVRVSRPGFYNVTGFLYVIPAASHPTALLSVRAFMGLLFCIFPMNLLVYSMNDLADVDIDMQNPRKGGLYGAQASASELRVCVALASIAVVVLPPLITSDLWWSLCWSTIGLIVNWLYNFGPQLSRVPVMDMLPPLAYLLTVPFAAKVMGDISALSQWFGGFLVFVVLRTQLWFQRFDHDADKAQGKHTTAVFIGPVAAALGVFLFLAGEFVCESLWGCRAAQAWTIFSGFVFVIELWLEKKDVTKALMAISGFVFLIPVMQCLQARGCDGCKPGTA